jgi:hypothetical protein
MRSKVFIHNDEMTCFHVAMQGTQKLVVMGCHNFKDEALFLKQWVGQKMNGTSGRFKDEYKRSNCRKLFSFTTRKNVF